MFSKKEQPVERTFKIEKNYLNFPVKYWDIAN